MIAFGGVLPEGDVAAPADGLELTHKAISGNDFSKVSRPPFPRGAFMRNLDRPVAGAITGDDCTRSGFNGGDVAGVILSTLGGLG